MLDYLTTLNSGPISPAGLAALYEFVLELVRREAAGA
jgi:hypothetical protein